jgi:phosphoenolpyruvate carboxylase
MTDPTTTQFSNDIRLLGNLLGTIIREQCGDADFELVEQVRHLARARRNGDTEAAQKMTALFIQADHSSRQTLIKAFSNYFQLINIAEDQQRIRVLREREGRDELTETVDEAIASLKKRGLTAAQMRDVLNGLRLRFVLTAHPSEAKRTEVLVKLRHIAEMLYDIEQKRLIPREHTLLEQNLAEEIEELWQTRPVRITQKQVADEVDFGVYFVTNVVMDVVVEIYNDIYTSLGMHYPDEDWSDLHRLLRFGSWIGGDRDGNPNVTADVTMQTLQTMRDAARNVYLDEIQYLMRHLTEESEPPETVERLNEILPPKNPVALTYPGELYREKLSHIWQKLLDNEYRSRLGLLDDLRLLQDVLRQNKGQRVAEGKLRQLIRKIRLFGLYLMPLDLREDARLHAAALAEILGYYNIAPNYADLPEEEKQAILTREIENPRPLLTQEVGHFTPETQAVIAAWRVVQQAYRRYSIGVIDTYIASMSENPSDVLTMLLLAKEVGVEDRLDLAPLFETIDDLKNAPHVMTTLFNNSAYLKHLKARKMRQQIMIGYSDSSKDGGYIASNWNLYTAQQTLTDVCEKHGISIELFHGRGGSIGRGGGPTNRAIMSQPPKSLRGGIKITEQGEVIAYRYSNADIARRHLHQVLNAVILSLGNAADSSIQPQWAETMDSLSEYGREAYRNFVYETDGFLDFWQTATPINELSRLRISSRPAKRGGKGGFAAMRAIPWVFSWMQNRAIIPSWFSVGTAFNRFCEEHPDGMAQLQGMYRDWLFFRALIDNTQLDVAKADMGILEIYAGLVDDAALRDQMFGRIRDEHALTTKMICSIIDQKELLDKAPAMKHSIERRNPYVDPLNFLQVQLLRELRAMTPETPEYERTLELVLATINGIAAGMKTTG